MAHSALWLLPRVPVLGLEGNSDFMSSLSPYLGFLRYVGSTVLVAGHSLVAGSD